MMGAGLLITLLMLLLGACSPGHQSAARHGVGIWQYVGCHIIEQTPSDVGAHVIHPFGDMKSGRFYFKQATSLVDDKNVTVTTGKPCPEFSGVELWV